MILSGVSGASPLIIRVEKHFFFFFFFFFFFYVLKSPGTNMSAVIILFKPTEQKKLKQSKQ